MKYDCYCYCPDKTREHGIIVSEWCADNWRHCKYVEKTGEAPENMRRS